MIAEVKRQEGVNLVDRVLEIYRDPTPSAEAPYVWRFSTRLRLGAAEVVTPLATPEARISVTDLLPSGCAPSTRLPRLGGRVTRAQSGRAALSRCWRSQALR